jgi:hypothetical protein
MAYVGMRSYLLDFDDSIYSLRDLCETLNEGELCTRLKMTIAQLSEHCSVKVCSTRVVSGNLLYRSQSVVISVRELSRACNVLRVMSAR